MGALNFSAVEILPALLNRTKDQTIRPAWKESKRAKPVADVINENIVSQITDKAKLVFTEPVPPRFSVCEYAAIYWKQRTTPGGCMFCRDCGMPSKVTGDKRSLYCDTEGCKKSGHFPKIVGYGIISEVFKVTMYRDSNGTFYCRDVHGEECHNARLAERDGFGSVVKMFWWLHNHYGLDTPKDFWVYRWKWTQPAGSIKQQEERL